MLTYGEDVEADALAKRGWTISAIARHLDRDRKTIRAYLNGTREPGRRKSSAPNALESFVPYLTARFADDAHLWATALYEEVQWDWFERRNAPWGGTAYVLLGTLPHSSRVRGVLAESLDQAHLIEAMDAVLRRLGGTARDWRTDRLATV